MLLALAGAVARDLACSAALKAITSGLGLCARSTAVERDLVSVHVHLWYADSELLVRSTHRPGHRVLATLALKHFRILDRAQSSHAGLSRGECPDEIANSIALGGCQLRTSSAEPMGNVTVRRSEPLPVLHQAPAPRRPHQQGR
jgi:hypothetical protein